MHYLNKTMISLCTIMVLMGCSSKDMKQLGGNMMTTSGGSPIGTLVGVGLGGVIYGIGSSIEDTDNTEVTYYTKKMIPDDEQNATIIAINENNSSKE